MCSVWLALDGVAMVLKGVWQAGTYYCECAVAAYEYIFKANHSARASCCSRVSVSVHMCRFTFFKASF